MNENIFYCKIGDIETHTPWVRPDITRLNAWYETWSLTPGFEDYEAYFVGNFAEKQFGSSTLDTWDVDVVLMNPTINNNTELKHLMDEAVRIGFENEQLIDIYYNNKLLDFKSFKPLKQVRAFNHFHKNRNGEVYDYYVKGDEVTELDGPLWEIFHPKPSKSVIKAYKRKEEGNYEGIQMRLSSEIFTPK